MKAFRTIHKVLLAVGAVVAFGIAAVLSVGAKPAVPVARPETKAGADDHTMFGGTPARNMVNLNAKHVPDKFNSEGPDVLWKVALGSRAYGGPIIAGGKIFVGTNNEQPRNKRDIDKNG